MPQFSQLLEQIIGTPVFDETGLTGTFNIDARWAPSRDPSTEPGNGTPEELAAMFTALPEQLGLKLEPSRAPMDVLVIDHVERPTED
jgi:uncharacterized protein (TIGR03435 family)